MIVWLPVVALFCVAMVLLVPFWMEDDLRDGRLLSIQATLWFEQHFQPEKPSSGRLVVLLHRYEHELSVSGKTSIGARLHGLRQLASSDRDNGRAVFRHCAELFRLLAVQHERVPAVGGSKVSASEILKHYASIRSEGTFSGTEEADVRDWIMKHPGDLRQHVEFIIAAIEAGGLPLT